MGKKRKKIKDKLTPQQERFCQHYVMNQSGVDAYRHAYPSSKAWKDNSVYPKASSMLADDKVAARISALASKALEVAEKKFEITVERVLQELAAMAFANADDYYEWGVKTVPVLDKNGNHRHDRNDEPMYENIPYAFVKPSDKLTRQQKAAIVGAGMSFSKTGEPVVEVKMGDKRAALRDLGTYLKLFNQTIDHNVTTTGSVKHTHDHDHKHTMPDIENIDDPREALKAFELARQSLAMGRPAGNA